jgi:hypothetical protein
MPVRKWLQPCDIVVDQFTTGILDTRKGDVGLKTTGSWVAGGVWALAFAR